MLVEAGEDVNQSDGEGMTPLMIYASGTYNTGAMRYLLDAGAKADLKNRDGKTASDLLAANPNLPARDIFN
jgi:ankyrin repeat protein